MADDTPGVQDFTHWTGEPFFEGFPAEGRQVYILLNEEQNRFDAFGIMEDSHQLVFRVRGTKAELERFLANMKDEGARVTYGAPPYDTKTGGDKPTGTDRPGNKNK